MATACTLRPRKPKAEQPAGQIPTELFFNVPPDRPAALVVLGKPALQVPGDDLIERRSLRPSTGIPLLGSLSPRDGCCPLAWTLSTGRDHGDTQLSEVPHSESGYRGHQGQRAVAVAGTMEAETSVRVASPLTFVTRLPTSPACTHQIMQTRNQWRASPLGGLGKRQKPQGKREAC